LSRRGSRSSGRIAVDTNILFSALRYKNGSEAMLLEWCSRGEIEIYVSDYIVEELSRVLRVEKLRVEEFLKQSRVIIVPDSYYTEVVRYTDYIKKAKRLNDISDRPVFIFARVFLDKNPQGYFITGDKGFFKFEKQLSHRVKTTRDFMETV
jgi:predicted nucleic acid-binding protein